MKAHSKATLAVLACALLAHCYTHNNAAEHFKGAIYAGTSDIQLTNSTGNLSTTTGTYSGALSASGITNTGDISTSGNSTVAGTLAVTGATTLRSTLAVTSAATFSAPIRLASAVTGVTAATGGDQASGYAIPLTASLFSVGTVGTSGDSVRLPTGAPLGHTVIVENRAATNTLDLFPGASGAINNKAGDAVLNVLAGKSYVCASLTAAAAATLWTCSGP